MPSAFRATALPFLALAGLAALAALVANGMAPPARRLAWTVFLPPPPVLPAAETRAMPPGPVPPLEPRKAAGGLPPGRSPAGPRPAIPPPGEGQAVEASSPIREAGWTEVWKAFQSGVPFLDARRSSEFAEGHIAGAWCAPVWEADLEDRLIAFKAARHPGSEDPIVIYCSGGDCRDSHLLAAKLLNEGYFHLLIYRDGFPDWVARNRPVEQGRP